ncbi:MAG: Crp/Fnr family transcriptional regulator [Wenzhouxiangella sp.]
MDASEISKLLARQDFFSGLKDEHRDWLAEQAVEAEFDAGQLVARAGEKADRFYLILEGELVVEVPALAGPSLEVIRLGADRIFGWSWLIRPYKWHFNARAGEPTRALDFDGKAILDRCEEDSEFGYELLKRFSSLMGARLESAQRKMMDQWAPEGMP